MIVREKDENKIQVAASSKHPEMDINELLGGKLSYLHENREKVVRRKAGEVLEDFSERLNDEIFMANCLSLKGTVSVQHKGGESTINYVSNVIDGFVVDFGDDRVFVDAYGNIAQNQENRDQMVEKYQEKINEAFPLVYEMKDPGKVTPTGVVAKSGEEINSLYKENDFSLEDI